jgi:hypothetical protein
LLQRNTGTPKILEARIIIPAAETAQEETALEKMSKNAVFAVVSNF